MTKFFVIQKNKRSFSLTRVKLLLNIRLYRALEKAFALVLFRFKLPQEYAVHIEYMLKLQNIGGEMK